ncbi:hypothetical protein V1477_001949, partial [Vespula maculifrons]
MSVQGEVEEDEDEDKDEDEDEDENEEGGGWKQVERSQGIRATSANSIVPYGTRPSFTRSDYDESKHTDIYNVIPKSFAIEIALTAFDFIARYAPISHGLMRERRKFYRKGAYKTVVKRKKLCRRRACRICFRIEAEKNRTRSARYGKTNDTEKRSRRRKKKAQNYYTEFRNGAKYDTRWKERTELVCTSVGISPGVVFTRLTSTLQRGQEEDQLRRQNSDYIPFVKRKNKSDVSLFPIYLCNNQITEEKKRTIRDI